MIASACTKESTTGKRLFSALMAGSVLLGLLGASPVWAFSLEDVSAKAKELAGQKFQAPKSNLPPALRDLKFADYQKIHFRRDKVEWADDKTPFKLSFYHEGMQFDTPVKINEVTASTVEEIKYDPSRFDFGDLQIDPKSVENLGWAGFRVMYPINKSDKLDEVMTMLGASYFRVVGKGQVYGLSARGLAIDTAAPSGEEFPRFREFWIEKPNPDDKQLIIYALLDSPRSTGAYRLVLRPGTDSVVDVQSRVYLRDQVSRLGIAPLTSMFLFGQNQPSKVLNYRHELHDSTGLSIANGNGEWIWRPLNNPKHLSVSSFTIENPKGFGLLQRGREFYRYEDLDDRYDKRPSAWVETRGDWGKGTVNLVEIPTADETNDNIVAYWNPEKLPEAGQPLEFNYRLHWSMDEDSLHSPDVAWVKQTMRSTGDVKQSNLVRQADGSLAFLVDFTGPKLKAMLDDAQVRGQVSVSDNADVVENNVRYNPETQGWRLTLRIKVKDPSKNVEMRAALVQDVINPDNAKPAAKGNEGKAVEAKETKVAANDAKAEKTAEAKGKAKAEKADKAAPAKADEKVTNADKPAEGKPEDGQAAAAEQPADADAATKPVTTEEVLTETWSYQLPADE